MPNPKTFTGRAAIAARCGSKLPAISPWVTACNCSICTKKGLHFVFLAPKSFQLRAGRGKNLREYLFTSTPSGISSASIAGSTCSRAAGRPDGTEVVALNV